MNLYIQHTLISLVLFSFSWAAQAAPSREALNLLSNNYDPQISVALGSSESVQHGCSKTLIRITGLDPLELVQREVTVDEYQPHGSSAPSQMRTVLLMPPTGGENALDQAYAKSLCKAGFRVALIKRWKGDTIAELDMGMHDRGTIRMVTAVRHVIEWLNPHEPQQLGILGTSVGGISAALILGYEPRVSAGFLIVAGAGMDQIIARSSEATLSKLREQRMKEYGFATLEEYEAALTPHVILDPIDFVGFSGPKEIFMVIAESDTTVATDRQLALWEAYGRPQDMRYNANHIWTILRMALFQKSTVVEFFENNLK